MWNTILWEVAWNQSVKWFFPTTNCSIFYSLAWNGGGIRSSVIDGRSSYSCEHDNSSNSSRCAHFHYSNPIWVTLIIEIRTSFRLVKILQQLVDLERNTQNIASDRTCHGSSLSSFPLFGSSKVLLVKQAVQFRMILFELAYLPTYEEHLISIRFFPLSYIKEWTIVPCVIHFSNITAILMLSVPQSARRITRCSAKESVLG